MALAIATVPLARDSDSRHSSAAVARVQEYCIEYEQRDVRLLQLRVSQHERVAAESTELIILRIMKLVLTQQSLIL